MKDAVKTYKDNGASFPQNSVAKLPGVGRLEWMVKVRKTYSTSTVLVSVLLYTLLAVIALVCVLPMWHVLMASISRPLEFGGFEGFLFVPIDFKISFESYSLLFTHKYLWTGYLNSVIYTAAAVVIGLIISVMAAYALTRKKLLFKKPILIFILITLFFSGGMVPFYIIINTLGMINTPMAMILPMCCNAMNIVMLRTGILAIPDAIFEAAELDGAGPIKILARIVVPLSVPFIIVVALFNGVANWNSWVNANMFLTEEFMNLYPLQLILRDILTGNISNMGIRPPDGFLEMYVEGIRMAAVIVASLPLILLYPFLQKHFEKGVIIGSVKG